MFQIAEDVGSDLMLQAAEVMRNLEHDPTGECCIKSFESSMRLMREQLAQIGNLHYKYQKERWFLHAAETYCKGVRDLNVPSRGLRAFRDYLAEYVRSRTAFGCCWMRPRRW